MFAKLRPATRLPALAALLLFIAALATGCGGGSGGGSNPGSIFTDLSASFFDSGTEGNPNLIRMTGSSTGNLVEVEVVIGGPTTSTDLYSFVFDLVLSKPDVAEYVDGSAILGTALTTSGNQSLQVLASQQGARVTVGVTKLGGGPGNGVTAAGESTVVGLVFRLLRPGTTTLTIAGSPGYEPTAQDSAGGTVDSVDFDANSARLIGI
jgi:hypothetical protein